MVLYGRLVWEGVKRKLMEISIQVGGLGRDQNDFQKKYEVKKLEFAWKSFSNKLNIFIYWVGISFARILVGR